jgi:superfamily II DNA or RNA helicase
MQSCWKEGYLAPLEYINHSVIDHTEIPVNKSLSDFDLDGYEKKIAGNRTEIIRSLAYAGSESKHVLVFCSSILQAESLQNDKKFCSSHRKN